MFRVTHRTVQLLNNVLKSQSRVHFDPKNQKALIRLPDSFLSKTFCSKTDKVVEAPKSPLSKLFEQHTQKTQEDPTDEKEGKETREQSWRRMKLTLIIFGVSFTCIGVYLVMELGSPRLNEDGQIIEDQLSGMSPVKQYVLRTVNELNYYRQLIKEPSRDKLLPDMIKHPYYSPQYTLVLEFTDVVVHPEWTYNTGWRFKKRPGLDHFLESLSGIYEIVIYTAEQGMTVFPIIEALDPKNHINYKLVRDATLFIDGRHVKDLDKLNRDLSRTIVVDWDGDSTKYHADNVFQIPKWTGNDDDLTLIHLSAFLLAISQNQIDDVREVVKYYNQFDDPIETFREKQKKLLELSEREVESSLKAEPAPIKRWTPSFIKKQY